MPRRIKVNKKLLSIVSEIFFLDEEEVTLELTPDDVETWDSLNHLILVTRQVQMQDQSAIRGRVKG